MSTPSKRGLSFTLSWGALEAPRSAELSLGTALRLMLVVALCAGAYELGRRHEKLAAQSAPQTSGVVIVERRDSKPERAAPSSAPGQAVGENPDVITPLNVRDPSALVMGPSGSEPPPAATAPVPTPRAGPIGPPARVYPPKEDKPSPDARF
jgi:hypothetical protein